MPVDTWKRNFTAFITSQTISLLGSALVQYAIVWYITLETKSGLMMTISVLCGFVPTFLLSPFAGVWADRYDRKKIIVLADGLIALVTLAMALVFAAGYKAIWLLLLAQALRAVGQAFHGPAVGAILPQMVPEDRLMRANGIIGSIQSAIMIVSPMLSGALLSLAPIEAIFLIDVVTAAAAIAILLGFLKVAPHAKAIAKQAVGYFEDMRLGFRYILEHRYLVGFFLYIGIFLVLVVPAAFLTPLQTTRSFGADVWRLTAIEVAFSGGMLAGGLLVAAWGGFRNRMHTMIAANLVMAVCTLGLGVVPWFWLYLVVMGIFGVVLPFFNSPSAVMIQEHVEQDYMGRVMSIQAMLMTSLMPLSMLLFGPLADLVRIEWLLVGTGLLMVVHALRAFGMRKLVETGLPRVPAPEAGPAAATATATGASLAPSAVTGSPPPGSVG